LFFATDTGNIYQFNNPGWINISGSFRLTTTAVFKDATLHNHTGDTTLDTIYTIPLPSLANGNVVRGNFMLSLGAQGTGTTRVSLVGGAGSGTIQQVITANANTVMSCEFIIGLAGGTSYIMVRWTFSGTTNASNIITQAPIGSLLSVGGTQNLFIKVQNANNSDNQSFQNLVVEVL
jgi:hypothetical protein